MVFYGLVLGDKILPLLARFPIVPQGNAVALSHHTTFFLAIRL